MTYSKAIEKLSLTTPKSLEENARLASWLLKTMPRGMPLRYKVAAMVVIRAADEYKERI